jgi:hypothetical protein
MPSGRNFVNGESRMIEYFCLQSKVFESLCRVKGRIDIRLLVSQRDL